MCKYAHILKLFKMWKRDLSKHNAERGLLFCKSSWKTFVNFVIYYTIGPIVLDVAHTYCDIKGLFVIAALNGRFWFCYDLS